MRTGRLLTNYCHRQNRLGLEKINLTYCPLIREQNNENWKLKTPSLHPQFFFQAHLQSWFFSPHSFRWCRATGVCNAQSLPLLPHTFPLLQPVLWGSSHRIPSFMNWPYRGSGSRSSPTQVHSSECSPAGTGCSSMGPTQLPIQAACSILGSSPASSKPNPPAAVWRCSRGSNGVPSGLIWNLCFGAWRASCPSPPQTWESAGLFLSHFSLSSVSHVSQSISYPFLNKLPLRAQAASLLVTPGYKNLAT